MDSTYWSNRNKPVYCRQLNQADKNWSKISVLRGVTTLQFRPLE